MAPQLRPLPSASAVDADRPFRVSSRCTGGDCVAVRVTDAGVEVTDTKVGSPTSLCFTPEDWTAFVAGVKDGEFDLLA